MTISLKPRLTFRRYRMYRREGFSRRSAWAWATLERWAIRHLRFELLRSFASWSIFKLWFDYKDDPTVDPHLMRHIEAAVKGGWETTCTDDHCALDEEVKSWN